MPAKTILLAEDDKDDQEFFSGFLKTRNDVMLLPIAENGEEVIEALQTLQPPAALPDVILLDQNMPKCNGLQTLQLLKENAAFRNIPVFMYSTYADEHLKERSAEGGAVMVFSKPYTLEGYGQMINDMLEMIAAK